MNTFPFICDLNLMFQEIAGVFDGRVLMSCELVLCLFFVGIYCSYELNVVFGDCI